MDKFGLVIEQDWTSFLLLEQLKNSILLDSITKMAPGKGKKTKASKGSRSPKESRASFRSTMTLMTVIKSAGPERISAKSRQMKHASMWHPCYPHEVI